MKLHIISNLVEKIKSLFKYYSIVKENTIKDNTPDINNYPTLEKRYGIRSIY